MSELLPSLDAQIWAVLDESWKQYLESLEGQADERKPLPSENRGSWFCPVVSRFDADMIRQIAVENDVNKIYDMGAGDCRLSYLLSNVGYEVVAYETIPTHPKRAREVMGEPMFELRLKDYYEDWMQLLLDDDLNRTLYCFMGGANRPPFIPDLKGMVIEGYWEKGTRFWKDGKVAKEW